MPDVIEQLRAYGEAVEHRIPPVAAPTITSHPQSQWGSQHRRLALVAVAAVVAVTLVVLVTGDDEPTGIVTTPSDTTAAEVTPPPTVPSAGDLGPGRPVWRPMAVSPLEPRWGAGAVWTGSEMLVFGGSRHDAAAPGAGSDGGVSYSDSGDDDPVLLDVTHFSDVAAYSPASDMWRSIAPLPTPLETVYSAVWAEDRLVAVGRTADEDRSAEDPRTVLLTYRLELDEWTTRDLDVEGLWGVAGAWTGEEVIYWGYPYHAPAEPAAAFAFTPNTEEIRDLDPGPLGFREHPGYAWTGERFIVWGGDHPVDSSPRGEGAAYDPVTGTWEILPESPNLGVMRGPEVVWDGTELLVWGGNSVPNQPSSAAAYDPANQTWRALDAAPIVGRNNAVSAWTGSEMVVVDGTVTFTDDGDAAAGTAALDPATGAWRTFPDPPGGSACGSVGVWSGSELLLWGGSVDCETPHVAREAGFRLVVSQDRGHAGVNQVVRDLDVGPMVRFEVPSSWSVADEVLTPNLGRSDRPWEILSAGTGRLAVNDESSRCAQFPTAATEAMEPDDVLVSIQAPGDGRTLPPRPASFDGISETESEWSQCVSEPTVFRQWFVGFSESGVPFYALVAAGPDAPADRLAQAWALLDSLSIEPLPDPEVTPIPDLAEPMSATVLAVRPNNPSFAVIDLISGTITEYAAGQHHLPADALSGAALTARGDAVVWIGDSVYVVPDANFSQTPSKITPEQVRTVPGVATELFVVPSPDGSRLWIVQPGAYWGERSDPTLIELVEIDTGTTLVEAEVDLDLRPVGATDDSLVFTSRRMIETESGWASDPKSSRIVRLNIDGSVDDLAPGTAIAVQADVVAALSADQTSLMLMDQQSGQMQVVEQPTPGTWDTTGGPSIPSTAQPLPAVSATGQLLITIGWDFDVNGAPAASRLYSVSMSDGTTHRIADFKGSTPLATWSRDGNRVLLVDQGELSTLDPWAADVEPAPMTPVPPEHFVLAAG